MRLLPLTCAPPPPDLPPEGGGYLEVGLEPGPHFLRELLEPRRIDEEKRDARYLVDRGLDPRQRRIGGAEYVLHLARAVAERVLGHRLQLGHDRCPVQLRPGRSRG